MSYTYDCAACGRSFPVDESGITNIRACPHCGEDPRYPKRDEEEKRDIIEAKEEAGRTEEFKGLKLMDCRYCGIPIAWDKEKKLAFDRADSSVHDCPKKPKPAPKVSGKYCDCGAETFTIRICRGCNRSVNSCTCPKPAIVVS